MSRAHRPAAPPRPDAGWIRSPRIGIAGFYGAGNFGDDLMAVLLGLFLERNGVPFTVHRLARDYATALGLPRTDSAAELVEDHDAVVWGGGGTLVQPRPMRLPTPMRRRIIEYRRIRDDLLRRIEEEGVPFHAVSIGGSGARPEEFHERGRRLVRALTSATTRLPEDLALFDAAAPVRYFPDVVLQTAAFFPVSARRAKRLTIGVDAYTANLIEQHGWFAIPFLWTLPLLRRDADFVFFDTTHASTAPFRGLRPPWRSANASTHQFGADLPADLARVASLDAVLSSRLHLGVTALSYGVPFFSLFGEAKSRLFMKDAGLERFVIRPRGFPRFLRTLLSPARFRAELDRYDAIDLSDLRRRSAGHLDTLLDFVRSVDPRPESG